MIPTIYVFFTGNTTHTTWPWMLIKKWSEWIGECQREWNGLGPGHSVHSIKWLVYTCLWLTDPTLLLFYCLVLFCLLKQWKIRQYQDYLHCSEANDKIKSNQDFCISIECSFSNFLEISISYKVCIIYER